MNLSPLEQVCCAIYVRTPEGEQADPFELLFSRVPIEGELIRLDDQSMIVNLVQHLPSVPLSGKRPLHAANLYCHPHKGR